MDIKRAGRQQEVKGKSPVKSGDFKKETKIKTKKPSIPPPPKPPDPAEHMKSPEEEEKQGEEKTDYAGNIVKMFQDAQKERMNIMLGVQQAMIASDRDMFKNDGDKETENMEIEGGMAGA